MEALQRLHMSPVGSPFGMNHHDSMLRASVASSQPETPDRKSPMDSRLIMQGNDAVRLTGVSEAISSQIAKFDSSEFDDDKEAGTQDAEGVWAPEIEQSFQEALAIYPPCGRRKIILSDEGKMYGRNELIARYIKLRTGKTRTRKQVSSHIQVLARRKLREVQAKLKTNTNTVTSAPFLDESHKEKAIQQFQQMSSAQIVTASLMQNKSSSGPTATPTSQTIHNSAQFWSPALHQSEDVKPFQSLKASLPITPSHDPWLGRSIATRKLRLLEFSAFVDYSSEHESYQKHLFVHIGNPEYSDPVLEPVDVRQIQDKFPEKSGGLKELFDKGPQDAFFLVKFWADLNTNSSLEDNPFYGVTTTYESTENMTIQCSTKVCSFGKQVVEKVETECPRFENGRYLYKIHRSPMCEYMINFILKLKHLPEKYMMNSVLENFTILQVITNRDTQETLLCTAYVFEVSTSEHGAQHHIYRLVKD